MVAAEFSVPRMYETRVHVHRIGGCPNDVHRIGKADRLKSIMPGEDRERVPGTLATVRLDLSTERPRYPFDSSPCVDSELVRRGT